MSKATSLLRAVERRMARRRRPGAVYIVTSYEDDDHVTDRDGRRWTLAEWEAAHGEVTTIQLRWGDEADDVALSHPIPADVWNRL